MNYEISNHCIAEITPYKLNITTFLLLILSVVFIPVAYIFVAAVFIAGLQKKNSSINTNKFSLLIYAYVSIGLLTSEYKLISAFFALLILLCYYSYLLFNSLNTYSIIKVKNTIYIVSIIVFIIGIMQYFNSDFAIPSKWVDASEYSLNKRIYSTFFNPNIFGFYINLIILISIENLNLKKIGLEWAVFIIGTICLILTFSRTAWVSLIISLIAATIFNKKYIRYAIIISLAILSFDTILGIGRVDPARAVEDSSFLYRLEVWKTCIEIIKDNPISGIGFGTLFKYVADYSSVVSTTIEHSHNIYIQIITETGIMGFTIFLVLLIKILIYLKEKLFTRKNKQYITAFAVFVMTMIHGAVDSVSLTPQIMMILSIYAGTVTTININN